MVSKSYLAHTKKIQYIYSFFWGPKWVSNKKSHIATEILSALLNHSAHINTKSEELKT